MIVWQIENMQNCLLFYPLFVFHQNLITTRLLHHFKTLLVMICQERLQVLNCKSIKRKQRIARWYHRHVKVCWSWLFSKHSYTSCFGCISPIGSTEAERAASDVRQPKTPYCATMVYKRESDLNFLQLQRAKKVDPERVSVLFINEDYSMKR